MGSAQSSYPGDAVGPQTSHIMWTKPLQSGGVVGGNNFVIEGDTYFEGSAYQQRFTNPIIIDGKLYYKEPVSFSGPSMGPTDCVDLRTGKLIWSRADVPSLSFGYIYDVQDPNQHGVYPPLLFSGGGGFFAFGPVTWQAFDADTGNPLFNITNVPSGTTLLGPNGEHLILSLVNLAPRGAPPDYYLQEWNSSKLWEPEYSGPSTSPPVVPVITTGGWTGGIVNIMGMYGPTPTYVPSSYDFNVSIPSLSTLSATPTVVAAFYNDMLICEAGTMPSSSTIAFRTVSSTPYTYFAINLNASVGAIGQVLWTNTLSAPASNVSVLTGPADPTARVFTEAYAETTQWVGYSMTTGKKIWGPTAGQTALDYYGNPATPNVQGVTAYGKLYSAGFGGILYCYDLTNGKVLWTYGNGGPGNSTYAGLETGFGEYPFFIQAIGNGVVYTATTEHTIETPIFKGALARAINATDGTEIWTLSDYTGEFGSMSFAIADGYATFFNGYDNQIYVVGRGPSATAVQAPMTAVTVGDSVVIQGTVTDISAGTKQDEQAARFPNGVPCASDASMKDWMGYVYQQQPCPTDFTGVEVTIDAIDPNNNFVHLGTATSDTSGLFHYAWKTPDVPGEYTVIATFAGTNGYWPSYAETAMYVQEAPPVTPPPQYPVPYDYTLAIVGMGIVLLIAIAIVGLLLLRKRP